MRTQGVCNDAERFVCARCRRGRQMPRRLRGRGCATMTSPERTRTDSFRKLRELGGAMGRAGLGYLPALRLRTLSYSPRVRPRLARLSPRPPWPLSKHSAGAHCAPPRTTARVTHIPKSRSGTRHATTHGHLQERRCTSSRRCPTTSESTIGRCSSPVA